MEELSTFSIILAIGIVLLIILGIYKICNKLFPNFYPNIIATFIWLALLALYPEVI
jgi:hypothetical protein